MFGYLKYHCNIIWYYKHIFFQIPYFIESSDDIRAIKLYDGELIAGINRQGSLESMSIASLPFKAEGGVNVGIDVFAKTEQELESHFRVINVDRVNFKF